MKNSVKYSLAGASALIVALAILNHRPEEKPVTPPASTAADSQEPLVARAGLDAAPTTVVQDTQTAQPNSETVAANEMSSEQRTRLADYSKLRRKAFLSDEESARRTSLLQDAAFLRGLSAILKSVAIDVEAQRLQESAIDVLLEAMKSGLQDVAEGALKEVVADARIEDASVPLEGRQGLAELKAEVMYQWTASDPRRSAAVESLLPGPVSKKIWANVREAQSRNLAESSAMAHR